MASGPARARVWAGKGASGRTEVRGASLGGTPRTSNSTPARGAPYPRATTTFSPLDRAARPVTGPTRRRRPGRLAVSLAALVATPWAVGSGAPEPVLRAPTPPVALARATAAPRCETSRLRLSTVDAPGGSLHDGVIVRLRDVGGRTCSLSGYASVRGVNRWDGALLSAAPTRTSYLGGWNRRGPLPVVTLRPGSGVASFLVTGVDAAVDNPSCPELTTLRVVIPPSTRVVTLTTSLNACRYFQVHPFVPGGRGTAG